MLSQAELATHGSEDYVWLQSLVCSPPLNVVPMCLFFGHCHGVSACKHVHKKKIRIFCHGLVTTFVVKSFSPKWLPCSSRNKISFQVPSLWKRNEFFYTEQRPLSLNINRRHSQFEIPCGGFNWKCYTPFLSFLRGEYPIGARQAKGL